MSCSGLEETTVPFWFEALALGSEFLEFCGLGLILSSGAVCGEWELGGEVWKSGLRIIHVSPVDGSIAANFEAGLNRNRQ